MKKHGFRSFRRQLNAAFLAVSLIPLLLCSVLLVQIFRLRISADTQQAAQQQLSAASAALENVHTHLEQTAEALREDPLVVQALFREEAEDSKVYAQLFRATESLRSFGTFHLYDISGCWRYSTQSAPENRSLPTNWGILYRAAHVPGSVVYDAAQESTVLLRAAALITDRYGAPVGYLVMEQDSAQLSALLGGLAGAQNQLLLLDAHWRPIFGTQPSQLQALTDSLREHLLSGKSLNSANFLFTAAQVPEAGLYLILQQPQVFTRGTLQLFYTVSALCALGCIIVSIFLGLQLSRQIFEPIGRLHRAIRRVEKNDLAVQVPIDRRENELTELARQFNHMVTTLSANQQALLENQKALNEAQIRMLQAQLNPHFLCNTLDTMKWISKINQVPQVALMSTNLADILRFCISPAEFVPLQRELEILERYVEIQKIRLSDSFTFEEDVPEKLRSCMVPKMLLQPLAENAILHGLSGVSAGQLLVTARETDEKLLEIRVCDNGCGLPPELLGPYRPPEQPTGHLGLLNVDTILRKHYGERFGLRLENREDGIGACVVACLPIEKGESQC